MSSDGISEDFASGHRRSHRWEPDFDVKYADRDYKKYALLAGFTEIGETIEETVKREVMEEVGLKVKKYQVLQKSAMVLYGYAFDGIFCEFGRRLGNYIGPRGAGIGGMVRAGGDSCDRKENISLTNEMILAFKKFHNLGVIVLTVFL